MYCKAIISSDIGTGSSYVNINGMHKAILNCIVNSSEMSVELAMTYGIY
ncbi:lipopolysaccharide biosynthesis protein RfbV [Vibrio cholerae]|nr:lipopolysaccharide biosynthesis protein RfbV [Vibrio cholerae]